MSIIMKFGGQALATAERIKQVSRLIRKYISSKPIVVVSALGGVTDQLEISAHKTSRTGKVYIKPVYKKHKSVLKKLSLDLRLLDPLFNELETAFEGVSLLKELTPRTFDYILSFGERLSARLMAAYLSKQKIDTKALDAFDIGLVTDSNFGNAHPLAKSSFYIKRKLKRYKNKLPVITGFIGKDKKNQITTLGRDGSDYTASFIGAALGVKEIQIWRNVPGVMTADPKVVRNAKVVKSITLGEASELVYYGNGVLHPYMLTPAVNKGIPVHILNILRPDLPGTVISNKYKSKKNIKTIACKKGVCLVNIISPEIFHHRRLARRVFEILSQHEIFYHLLSSSEISVSFSTDIGQKRLKDALAEISSFASVDLLKQKAIICVIGEGIKDNQKIISDVFLRLTAGKIKIEMISHDPLKTNLTFMINNKDTKKAVNSIHKLIF